jgi:hypothetical protein
MTSLFMGAKGPMGGPIQWNLSMIMTQNSLDLSFKNDYNLVTLNLGVGIQETAFVFHMNIICFSWQSSYLS